MRIRSRGAAAANGAPRTATSVRAPVRTRADTATGTAAAGVRARSLRIPTAAAATRRMATISAIHGHRGG